MSLESKIEVLTEAVNRLTAALAQQPVPQAASAVVAATPVPAPALVAPVAAAAPAPVAEVTLTAPMPPLPSFMPPAGPVVTAPSAPFSDTKGLIAYMTSAYQVLGAEKGAHLGNVLSTLGYANVNDVKPEHYPALFASVEALKGA